MNSKKKGFWSGALGIGVLAIILLLEPAMAVTLDFTVSATVTDLSRAKITTDYRGVDNNTITEYEQYTYSVGQEYFSYDSTGSISDDHNVAVQTNLSATHSPRSGIAGSDFAENMGSGQHNDTHSCCVLGVRASGADLVAVSFAGITPTVISQDFVIEANRGEAAVGWTKITENVTTKTLADYRGARVVVAGNGFCERYPAGPTDEKSIKEGICPWGGDGRGYPVFTPRTSASSDTEQRYTDYRVYRRA